MEVIVCCTKDCEEKVEYYNTSEDSYYCEECAYTMFNPGECVKLCNSSIIKLLIRLSKRIIVEILDYTCQEQLNFKWKHLLEQLRVFKDEIQRIEEELEDILKMKRLKDLQNLLLRSHYIKFQITSSEIYKIYLLHKDLNKHRLNEIKNKKTSKINQIGIIIDFEIKEEECQKNNLYINSIESKSLLYNQLEEATKESIKEVENAEQLDYKFMYECTENEQFEEIVEYNQELNTIKTQFEPQAISYDAYKSIFENIMCQVTHASIYSNVYFNLNDQKCINLLKVLSYLKLPEVNFYYFNYVPTVSEDVSRFIIDSMPTQKYFYFNVLKQEQVKCSNYFEALKVAASKTLKLYQVNNTDFSAKEFCDIVSAAKSCKNLYFSFCLIPLDNECEFEENTEEWEIENIELCYSGGSSYSNWSENPARFENLIASISKCKSLSKSLKTLYIGNCDIVKTNVQEILNKYELNEIKISGV